MTDGRRPPRGAALGAAGRLPALVVALLALPALLVGLVGGGVRPARADDEALVRVMAEQAAIHTGPGFAYRVVYTATRGEVLPVLERATRAHWFRVRLPDGTGGWVLGDEVFPLDLETADAHRGPSMWHRLGKAVFSPSPLVEGHLGMSFSAGIIGGDSAFLFRPAFLLESHIAIEGFVGATVGSQVDVVYYGGGPNIYLFPSSPVTPFLSSAVGGAWSRPKADQFTTPEANFAMLNVGGGLFFALKKRVTLRFDARRYVVFDPNHTRGLLEFTSALGWVF